MAEIFGRYEVESALGAALAFKPDGQAGSLPSGSKPQIRGCFLRKSVFLRSGEKM